MRFFNTTGPCNPEKHYMLPPEPRLPEARGLIAQEHYFVVHAPRQTGKTTTLWTLARELTAEGAVLAVCFSCESAEPGGDDVDFAEAAVLDVIRRETRLMKVAPELLPPDPWPEAPTGRRLATGLTEWTKQCPRPLVLFFDEIDALRGESLRSVLRQLRDGFRSRPGAFPASVVLCGLRDVRDYKAASGDDPTRLGTASPFNIKVESLRLGDFDEAQVRELYAQHTAETGQVFIEPALARAWELSKGQPWLTNAVGREIVEKIAPDPAQPVTVQHVDEAKERLILARATHLDSLAAKLDEPRVRRVIEPLVVGDFAMTDVVYNDDLLYLRDLGLLAAGRPARIANPIYQEVIIRVLASRTEENLAIVEPRTFVAADGSLDIDRIVRDFAGFWREHGEILAGGVPYHEAAPHLVFMAYLQRVVNGGGYITREYGIGRGRIDLLVRWRYRDGEGKPAEQREAAELNVWRTGRRDPLSQGLTQLDDYLARLGLDTGLLVIFDQRDSAPPIEDRTHIEQVTSPGGRAVTLLRA